MSTIPTCRVRAVITDSDGGLPIAGAIITAQLSSYEVSGDVGYVVPQFVTAETDAAGQAFLDLWPNQLGSASSFYNIKIVSPNGKQLRTTAVVPNQPTADLHAIAELPVYDGKPDGAIVISQVLAARDVAVAGATTATQAKDVAVSAKGTAETKAAEASAAKDSASASEIAAIGARNQANFAATNAASDRVLAQSAASTATGARDDAAASKTQAASSASAAATSATTASTAKANAETAASTATTKASEATGAASTATTKAADATAANTAAQAAKQTATDKATAAAASAQQAADTLASTVKKAELSATSGAVAVGTGYGVPLQTVLDNAPLVAANMQGVDDRAKLLAAFGEAKASGRPVTLGRDFTLTALLDFDFEGASLTLDYGGHAIHHDSRNMRLRNVIGGQIIQPDHRNITAPWVISRWAADGSWLADGAQVMATLTQTNERGYYCPTVNDQDIWSMLPPEVQNQTILAGLEIYDSVGVVMKQARGRQVCYDFVDCNYCGAELEIECGGKAVWGTVVFGNLGSSAWGVGNWASGYVEYGAHSGVTFMRNKKPEAGPMRLYRCGESGVKTNQNNTHGRDGVLRSTRCYDGHFHDITSVECVYDGTDFQADYGPEIERAEDFTLAQYPWRKLPTNHRIERCTSVRGRMTGHISDGVNTVTDITATDGRTTGIMIDGGASKVSRLTSLNNNGGNTAIGAHQVLVGGAADVSDVTVIADATRTQGFAYYGPESKLRGLVNATAANLPVTCDLATDFAGTLQVGSPKSGTDFADINFNVRGQGFQSFARVRAVLGYGVPGQERGVLDLMARAEPGAQNMDAAGWHTGARLGLSAGGFLAGRLAQGSPGGEFMPGMWAFYQDGASIKFVARRHDGSTAGPVTIVA